MKDLAKRFFLLLHLFLTQALRAASTSSSSATPTTPRKSTRRRSSTAARPAAPSSRPRWRRCCASSQTAIRRRWNIYAAQASDGDNFSEDSERCAQLLATTILPICQYFAYIEVGDDARLAGFPAPPTRSLAHLRRDRAGALELRDAPGRAAEPTSSRCSTSCSPTAGSRRHERSSSAPRSIASRTHAVRGRRVGLRHAAPRSMTRSRRSRSANSGSIPIRTRSS